MNRLELYVHNDAKGNYNSFMAWSSVCDHAGYGESEPEALANHRRRILDHIKNLETVVGNELPIVKVDFAGSPLKDSPSPSDTSST